MKMLEAAKATVAKACEHGYSSMSSNVKELDYPHIAEMLWKMENTEMSPAKTGRWLGWIQAACVSGTHGEMTLEDCKLINMSFAED